MSSAAPSHFLTGGFYLRIIMRNLKIKVPVGWMVRGFIEVEAKTLGEAAEIARSDMAKDGIGLPEGEFVKGSYEVDDEAMDVFQSDKVNEQAFANEELLNGL